MILVSFIGITKNFVVKYFFSENILFLGIHDNNTSWEEVKTIETQHDITTGSLPVSVNGTHRSSNNSTDGSPLSTWIGGSVVRDFEHSSNKGFSWINDSNGRMIFL